MIAIRIIGVVAMLALGARAQADGTLVLYGNAVGPDGDHVLRIDGKLQVLTATPAPPSVSLGKSCATAVNALGVRWVGANPLGATELLRIDAGGNSMPSVVLSHNPVQIAAAVDGRVYALTRIPLLAPGPMYCVDPGANIAWTSWEGPSAYTVVYPRQMCVTTGGELWIGDVTPPHSQFWAKALLLRIDPDTGSVMQSLSLPDLSGQSGDEGIGQLSGDPDGAIWVTHFGAPDGFGRLVRTNGRDILQTMVIDGGQNQFSSDMRVDGVGRLYVHSIWNSGAIPPQYATKVFRYDPRNPTVKDAIWDLGGTVFGHALGPTGEDLYALSKLVEAPNTMRVVRLNLVTGVQSSRSLESAWLDLEQPNGDPTGFIYANVVDRQGDNDGDGAPNGVETAAGSNPFDALSRPNGPKVYLSFAQSNGALILRYVDPDGILNPTGGLDLTSLSLVSSQHGQIFQYLLSFLTFVQVSPDQTEVTAFFGALAIPADMKWQFEATVKDKTGATGWDWQVSRPGDL